MQLPCYPGNQGDFSDNCLQNLRNGLMAESVLICNFLSISISLKPGRKNERGSHPCSLDDLTPPASSSSTASTKSTLNDVSGDDLVDDLGLAGLQHHFDDFDYEAESNRLINSF